MPNRRIAALTVAALTAGGSVVLASPARSLPDPVDGQCPEAFPVADLVPGQPVDGLSVTRGTLPDVFTGEVLGVLDDGVAAGFDMIMVRLTSAELDRVGGIWSGMSGSPVYAADGRLIGAVAYGLAAGSSPVAGVTPAAEMRALLAPTTANAQLLPQKVRVTKRLQARIVESGAANAAQAASGLERLPLPVAVSGVYDNKRLSQLAGKLRLPGAVLYRAGAAPAAPVAAEDVDIFAGSNIAASMAYGDLSAVAVGTTTMVCDDQVVAFGHPFNFTGPTTLSLHGADAIYIQEDPLGAPFKVANPTGPAGVIDQDRMAGIKGLIGTPPRTTKVHTTVTLGGVTRQADTFVSVPDFLPDATVFGGLGSLDRVFDHIGPGSATVSFVVAGKADGQPFTLSRTNRFADPYDITFNALFEAGDAVAQLVFNEISNVTIDTVDVTAALSEQEKAFKVGKVLYKFKKHGVTKWKTLKSDSVVKARQGRKLRLKVSLVSAMNKFGSRTESLVVPLPAEAFRGNSGSLTLGAGYAGGGEEFEFEGEEPFDEETPATFAELLAGIADAPRNDELTGQVDLFSEFDSTFLTSSAKKNVVDVLLNQKSWEIRVVK